MRSLLKEILANPKALALAVLVHVFFIGILVVSFQWTSTPTPSQPKVDIVKAVAVDEKKIQAEVDKLKRAEARKKRKARDVERRRKREEQRLAKLRKERAAEKKRQKKLQAQRKAEEAKLAKARAEKQKEEKRLAQAEAKRKQLEEQKRRQAEAAARQKAIAAEQEALRKAREKRLSGLRGQYVADIKNKVERKWIKPASAKEGQSCQVAVKQIPGGEVIDVKVTRCTGDEVFRRSVESAVYSASPLPVPSDPALFDREIVFTFAPKKR